MAGHRTIQQVLDKYGLNYPDDVTSTFEQPPQQTSAQRIASQVKGRPGGGQRGGQRPSGG